MGHARLVETVRAYLDIPLEVLVLLTQSLGVPARVQK